ncbi:hypothetical protein CTRI78_v004371 [Colletotrichum trifolii]|uniref:Centrosomin N-terminal motif 1 domain-containing protein n=1 Tax=Colletotrichum trifolii TaxID=5466 RepID=A0A4R8RH49_COLTR|nr:hypothetical protein CTRI78_v004371 [Colletotrichum trifolii]
MGVKEMEETFSTLHKQNFDLKLELYHRRERQNVLEERIDALETEKAQMDEVNDKLLDELEKRDKAVQEAVRMIVTLETQVEKLAEEREMVRHVEASGYFPPEELDPRLNGPTPQPRMANLDRLEEDAKTLNRMPSFLSERSETTENLRQVYLTSRGSILSLPKAISEGIEDVEGRRDNSLTSPSLSVLSESSFVSVYGEREDQDETIVAAAEDSPKVGVTLPQAQQRKLSQGNDNSRFPRPVAVATSKSNRPSRSSSMARTPGPGQFQSIRDIIDHTSPLQQLARLDHNLLDSTSAREHYAKTRGQSHQQAMDNKPQEALFPDASPAPLAPDRRSSLGAKTGSSLRQQPINGKLQKPPSRMGSRRGSIDGHMIQLAESVAQAFHHEPKPGNRSKDHHYPPTSGAPRGHRMNFFRRSIGGSSPSPSLEPMSPPATDQMAGARIVSMGVPSWVQRSSALDDDERASATPPPIMRNPRTVRSSSFDNGAPISEQSPATPATPATPHTTLPPVAKGTGSSDSTPASRPSSGGASLNKRKWLSGFGRTSSLKNRAG